MRRYLKLIIVLVMVFPMIVFATSYDNAKSTIDSYYKKFLVPERYLNTDKANFITVDEFNKSKTSENNSSSYMFDGTKFWALGKNVISSTGIAVDADASVNTKVVESVYPDTRVTGSGTYDTPWMFVDRYKVTVNSKGNGTIKSDNSPSSIEKESLDKYATAGNSVSFYISPDSGYDYLSNDCKSVSSYSEGTLTISNVQKDIECNVEFVAGDYGHVLPRPKKEITTAKHGKLTYSMSKPIPESFASNYGVGYYAGRDLNIRISKIEIPKRTGWVFEGYYVNGKVLVYANGNFEETYKVIDENTKPDDIKPRFHEKEYTVKLNQNGGSGGATSVHAVFEHDLPSITIPKIPGYVFEGYYEKSDNNNRGKKYIDNNGQATSSCEPWDQDVANPEIYAHYRACRAGYKCPTGNDETACEVGYHQSNVGKTSCDKCSAGTIAPSTGTVNCSACPAGTYQDQPGSTTCKDCPNGTYNSGTGKSGCSACGAGKINSGTRNTSCSTNCSNGSKVSAYATPSWNSSSNSISSICRISTCVTGYHLNNSNNNNACVANTFTIAYYGNGGSGSTGSHSCTYDQACTLRSNGFSYSGKVFIGWKKENGGGNLGAGASVKNATTVNGQTVTYYAQWVNRCSSVTYRNGSTCSKSCGGGTYNRLAYDAYDGSRCSGNDLSSGGSSCNTHACCKPGNVPAEGCCTGACEWYCCPSGSYPKWTIWGTVCRRDC